ncbi:E3 ubiquitin-protein ligase RNF135 isoform X2 [Apodemus sylvaticus]|uniref:E3 ubiquitin-protein ligase RNF135 isoform X2 n=1 Tax=Apodemus sylvaticus TaxID=10129 RepID=UPI002242ADEE|nr:E3 ubiquitin-protein ligase RNF135 isoform X2 [Apodemus sylvaticus]
MAAACPATAVPVWLSEDDLSCIICQGLLDWPTTLPCGHSFCLRCLDGLWSTKRAGVDGCPWSCPICRKGATTKPVLHKNPLLQDLVDKYRQAALELEAGPEPQPVPAPRSLCRPTPPQDSSSEEEFSLDSPKPVTFSSSQKKIQEILQNLEEIQEKLQGSVSWRETPREQIRDMTSSLCLLPDQRLPRKASHFPLWAISPTFDLRSISCNLEVSNNCRRVTVAHGLHSYPWSPERFSISQVLCSQALSSGKKYWEVDTRNCRHWAVGVASWGMKRDGMLGRTMDSWCIEWKGPGQFSAWAMMKKTDLHSGLPEVVGVWLDLDLGKLAFSVAGQERLLYECAVSSSSPLHPAFWLYGLSPGNYLEIKQLNT